MKYTVDAVPIGEGVSSKVYKCTNLNDDQNNSKYALKVIKNKWLY